MPSSNEVAHSGKAQQIRVVMSVSPFGCQDGVRVAFAIFKRQVLYVIPVFGDSTCSALEKNQIQLKNNFSMTFEYIMIKNRKSAFLHYTNRTSCGFLFTLVVENWAK